MKYRIDSNTTEVRTLYFGTFFKKLIKIKTMGKKIKTWEYT